MGQELSCGERRRESGLFHAVQDGELELVEAMVEAHPSVLELTIEYPIYFELGLKNVSLQ